MPPSRRAYLETIGTTLGAAGLLASASPVAAHEKPTLDSHPADPSNYSSANRETDEDIRWYVIHVAQGSYESVITVFQNPDWNASTHYVMDNAEDPRMTRMVDESDIGWHAGNWPYNKHSLGIEHAGFVGKTEYVDGTYDASARLAQWAAETYDFPMEVKRYDIAPCDPLSAPGGVIGHDQIPHPYDCTQPGGISGHTDPGSTWNWGRFEGFLRRFHLDVGDHLVTQSAQDVHAGPREGTPVKATAPKGTPGTVADGPVDDGDTRWYKVAYGDGIRHGWTTAEGLLYARFREGSSVTTTSGLSVRAEPTPDAPRQTVAAEGTAGTVVDGPVDAAGYRWFEVDYEGSTQTGWSAGYWLS